ncbi:MAG: carotenoid biosynthesis protein [Bacteroidota bacterium]
MKQTINNYFLYFLILVYVSGSIGFVLNPNFFSPFTPFTLLFTCFVYLLHQPTEGRNFILPFISIALIGYAAEVIGVKTGWIFGSYDYGNGLGIKLFGVPLVISLNWALLISAGIITVRTFIANKYMVLLLSALLVTGIDLLIEQVAFKLDFWQFRSGMPGWHNYVGWIVVAYISPYFVYARIIKGNRKIAFITLSLQIIFFATLYLFM